MGLSRRKFTREMKMAAIRRLEAGSSAVEVARAFEINLNVLHRWRKEFRRDSNTFFATAEKIAGSLNGIVRRCNARLQFQCDILRSPSPAHCFADWPGVGSGIFKTDSRTSDRIL